MTKFVKLMAAACLFMSPAVFADWHGGKVMSVQIAYDGSTVSITIAGHTRSNCTCYPAWSNTLCLNRTRPSFREEVAMVYSARARGTDLFVNINETTCFIEAMYEAD
jgi:hypothetical protein